MIDTDELHERLNALAERSWLSNHLDVPAPQQQQLELIEVLALGFLGLIRAVKDLSESVIASGPE